MLTSPSLINQFRFTQISSKKCRTDTVIDFVYTCVIQILPLDEDLSSPGLLRNNFEIMYRVRRP